MSQLKEQYDKINQEFDAEHYRINLFIIILFAMVFSAVLAYVWAWHTADILYERKMDILKDQIMELQHEREKDGKLPLIQFL